MNKQAAKFEPGQRLPNGALILASKIGDRWANTHIVLAQRGTEYVTWVVNDSTKEACWGHYNDSLWRAVADYELRG